MAGRVQHTKMPLVIVVAVVVLMTGMAVGIVAAQDDDSFMSCQSNQDCQATPNSYCVERGVEGGVEKYCQCFPTHNNQSGTCLPNNIGDVCKRNTDCSDVIENTHCPKKVGKCRCRFGYRKHGDNECKAFEIGTVCKKNEQCQVVIDNSRCVRDSGISVDGKKRCTCIKNYRPEVSKNNETICIQPVLGSSCKSRSDCEMIGDDNVTCLEGKCRCDYGFYEKSYNNDTSVCSLISLNGVCSKQKDCDHIIHSVCDDNVFQCLCKTGYREEKNQTTSTSTCVRTLLNTACDFDHHCPAQHSICDFDTGFCNCMGRYLPTEDGSGCYIRYLNDSCKINEDCDKFISNSECSAAQNHSCSCKDIYLPSDNMSSCILPIIDNMNCTTNSTCQILVQHSFCKDEKDQNVCACQTGYDVTPDFNNCHEKNLLDSCYNNEDCSTTNPFSECSGTPKVCQCVSGYILHSNSNSNQPEVRPFCRPRVLGRHDCQTPSDCSDAVTNSTCVQCRDLTEEHPFCRANCLGDNIDYCTTSTCLCRPGFQSARGGTLCQARKLWDDCSVEDDCATMPNAVCLPGQGCWCRSGFKPLGMDTCLKRVLKDMCYTDSDCHDVIPGSHCSVNIFDGDHDNDDDDKKDDVRTEGTCACISGYNPVNGTICQKRKIGDKTCSSHFDCDDAVAGSVCSNAMCICPPGHLPGRDLSSCTARTLHGPYCSSDVDCNGVIAHAQCSNHRCVCKTGYRNESDKICVKFKLGDSGCRDVQDCASAVENSTCSGGSGSQDSFCACVSGHHPDVIDNETCVARNISGHWCVRDEDCSHSVPNSYCDEFDGQCACVSGFYHQDEGTQCTKRILGDECRVTSDCSDVINNSTCKNDVCTCTPGFDPGLDPSSCFPKPKYIGSPCIYSTQCHDIHVSSTCNSSSDDVINRCTCPNDSFVSVSKKECVKLPSKIGDRCRASIHCSRRLVNSICNHGNGTCVCKHGYFQDEEGYACTSLPVQFGDRCLHHGHCSSNLPLAVCDRDNNTCICRYGYTQVSNDKCLERPHIPAFKRYPDPDPPTKCKDSCDDQNNTICVEIVKNISSLCRCDHRFASAYNKKECLPVQTYMYKLKLSQHAGKYDYGPLPFKHLYKSSQLTAYTRFARRITHNGIMHLIRGTPFRFRYVTSEVLNFKPIDHETSNQSAVGVEATILIHFKATPKYYGATPARLIDTIIRRHLSRSSRELGTSKLLVGSPLKRSSIVTDFDECKWPGHNDCSPDAMCINTLGSFMCVCRYDHVDMSLTQGKRKGRVCVIPPKTESDSSKCSTDNCQTKWEFVALVLTLVLLVVMGFIVYECIQRKQSFNARKLYERFGTTRIRKLKLNTAGMKRLQERKKYRKKYKKKAKKEMKRMKKMNKGKGKSSGTEDSDWGEKSAPATPSVIIDTEELPPSPSEIIHTPTIPIIETDDCSTMSLGQGHNDLEDFPEVATISPVPRPSPNYDPDDSVTIYIDD